MSSSESNLAIPLLDASREHPPRSPDGTRGGPSSSPSNHPLPHPPTSTDDDGLSVRKKVRNVRKIQKVFGCYKIQIVLKSSKKKAW